MENKTNSQNVTEPRYCWVFYVVHGGLTVRVSPFLPTPKTVEVCEIETKQHITILTGEYVDCVQMDRVLYVSQKVFDGLQ